MWIKKNKDYQIFDEILKYEGKLKINKRKIDFIVKKNKLKNRDEDFFFLGRVDQFVVDCCFYKNDQKS